FVAWRNRSYEVSVRRAPAATAVMAPANRPASTARASQAFHRRRRSARRHMLGAAIAAILGIRGAEVLAGRPVVAYGCLDPLQSSCGFGASPARVSIGLVTAPGPTSAEIAEVRPTAMVAGGSAIARAADGRVLFVDGALPGEAVRVEITGEHRN